MKFAPEPDLVGTPWEGVPTETFMRWSFQLQNRVDDLPTLERVLRLTTQERAGFGDCAPVFRFAVTPYYLLLADRDDPSCPIRKQVVPLPQERLVLPGGLSDPLGEESREAAPNLIHRYPDRALLLVTDRCPIYCRFCTRRRIVGRTERQTTRALLREALDYVRTHRELREVILSGGDALMLSNAQIAFILKELRTMEHVEIIRIATRIPVTGPMRIDDELAAILRAHAPIYVMTHFNHPRETTRSAAKSVAKLVDAGIVVYNQSVLLRDVNDQSSVIAELNRWLIANRITPYYLHQCDQAEGIEHFRTPLETGLRIIDDLRGHVSGLCVPQLCVDVPGGLGKGDRAAEMVDRARGSNRDVSHVLGRSRYVPGSGGTLVTKSGFLFIDSDASHH